MHCPICCHSMFQPLHLIQSIILSYIFPNHSLPLSVLHTLYLLCIYSISFHSSPLNLSSGFVYIHFFFIHPLQMDTAVIPLTLDTTLLPSPQTKFSSIHPSFLKSIFQKVFSTCSPLLEVRSLFVAHCCHPSGPSFTIKGQSITSGLCLQASHNRENVISLIYSG